MAGGEVSVIIEVEGAIMGVGTLLDVVGTMGVGTKTGELLAGVVVSVGGVVSNEVVVALGLGAAGNEVAGNASINGNETVRKKGAFTLSIYLGWKM
jgi:hypothetical protein